MGRHKDIDTERKYGEDEFNPHEYKAQMTTDTVFGIAEHDVEAGEQVRVHLPPEPPEFSKEHLEHTLIKVYNDITKDVTIKYALVKSLKALVKNMVALGIDRYTEHDLECFQTITDGLDSIAHLEYTENF